MPQASGSKAAELLGNKRADISSRLEGMSGLEITREFTEATDAYFRSRMREIWPAESKVENSPFALIAVGGYGRKELCPHSDVDILVVYEKRIPPEALDLAQSLFYPLWDLGLDLGHGFRSIKDCLSLSRKDFSVLASLLDARFIDGSVKVFDRFVQRFMEKVVAKKRDPFVKWLTRQERERFARFGDASALLEPDLKRGRGSLRDYHHVLWVGNAFYGVRGVGALLRAGTLTEAQAHVLKDQAQFLLKVRSLLHKISGRRNDRLHLAHQPGIARSLGYSDGGEVPGVEQFLTRLHREMAGLKAIRAACINSVMEKPQVSTSVVTPGIVLTGAGLDFDLPRGYPDDPRVLLDIFSTCAETGEPLSWQARGFVSGHLYLVKEELSQSEDAARAFVEILCSGRAAFVLEQMMETGFLGAFIPDFGRVQDLVQFDTYHIHPVGWHTLEVLRLLEKPKRSGEFGPLRVELASSRVLMLSAFFHDIGKGLGGGHSTHGERIVREILVNWNMPDSLVEDVAFLVAEHLTLFEVATRRDLDDEAVVASVAMDAANERRLQCLLLLTWADAKATGPGAWTKWTASLVGELFSKVRKMVSTGGFANGDAARRVETARSEIMEALADKGERVLQMRLDGMPSRYLSGVPASDIIRHIEMTERLEEVVEEDRRVRPSGRGGEGVVIAEVRELTEQECLEISVAGADDSRLFTALSGVLSLMGLNILSAQGFAWRGGTSIYLFAVSAPATPPSLDQLRGRIVGMVRSAMLGNLAVAEGLADLRQSPLVAKSDDGGVVIKVDNDSSDFYTIVEIQAPDRVGFLHDAVRAFSELGLSVQLAKVATYGGRAADSFYVREASGGKVYGIDRLRSIESSLRNSLNN